MTIAMTDERLFVKIVDFIPLDPPEGHTRQALCTLYGALLWSYNSKAGDILNHSKQELLDLPNFGRTSLPLLEHILKAELGFELERDRPDAWPPAEGQSPEVTRARFVAIREAVIDGVFRPELLVPAPAPKLPGAPARSAEVLKT